VHKKRGEREEIKMRKTAVSILFALILITSTLLVNIKFAYGTWYFKPAYIDYAPFGVPDFDQKQDAWTNPRTGKWSYCGPTAVANSLWWLDSKYESNPIPPPARNDHFPLVTNYSSWDDHDPQNVPPFVADLAWRMDTDGKRTGDNHNGTRVTDMAQGIENYLLAHGLYDMFYVKKVKMPTFKNVTDEVLECEDTILLLGFWQQPSAGVWVRVGGHYVTVSGVDFANNQIAFCDPMTDNAEPQPHGGGGQGVVSPHKSPHPAGPPGGKDPTHNDAGSVSYDFYGVTGSSPSPGGPQLGINYEPYNLTGIMNNLQGQNCPGEFQGTQGKYNPALQVFTEVEYGIFISPWYAKPPAKDYAPSGVPDFDQRQDNWKNSQTHKWSYCGPAAEADSLWWLDSYYEPKPIPPPTVNDHFPLVTNYSSWDDHDPRNTPLLIQDLARYMDTDGIRTGIAHNGTLVWDMQTGIDQYIRDKHLDWKLYEHTDPAPPVELIYDELVKCQDIVLLLGFWQNSGSSWWRIGGHYVTVVGMNLTDMYMAISDPIQDKAEAGGMGGVPVFHTHTQPEPPYTTHNNASLVSHDLYHIIYDPCPGGPYSLENYWNATIDQNFIGQNFNPTQLDYYVPGIPVHTQIDYAIVVSCKTGLVVAGSQDTGVYAWDFYGNLQWQNVLDAPVVSVAMDDNGTYIAAGTRNEMPPVTGSLWLFDSLGNIKWTKPGLPISLSYDGGWMGTESMSVDLKYNAYNKTDVVAAATDNGLYLYDQSGNLIWHYYDGFPETIVRISQDGNYIVCASATGPGAAEGVHYFSSLADGKPGWSANDGKPQWTFYMTDTGGVFWTAISGLGDYVAVSGWFVEPQAYVVLLDKTGAFVWTPYKLARPGYVRVDMPCSGRSIVAVNDNPTDINGTDLTYWSDMKDGTPGWSAADQTPVWTYWPGKETGGGHTGTDDFYTVSISQNGDNIATGGIPKNIYVLKKDSTLKQTIGLMPGAVQSVDLTFTGKYGAAGDNAGNVWFFSNATGLLGNAMTGGAIHSIAVSKIYPCMLPYPVHDVAITKVDNLKTGCQPRPTVCKGMNDTVFVTVLNQGDYQETFNVSVYVNSTKIGAKAVTLNSGESGVISFTWITAGCVEYSNFTVNAYASIVPEEIDVYDNTFIEQGRVTVVHVGDVDGNGFVDTKDIAKVAGAFGSLRVDDPKDPRYGQYWHPTLCWLCPHSPNADIDGNGFTDTKDLATTARNYGWLKP
jgi:hypothetical protein